MKLVVEIPDAIASLALDNNRDDAAEKAGIPTSAMRNYKWALLNGEILEDQADTELVKEMVRRKKSEQQYMDRNRIERKSFREYARMENALTGYTSKLVELLTTYPPKQWKRVKSSSADETGTVGVIQVTDTHLNELVHLPHNVYDFPVASQRIEKLACRAKAYFRSQNVQHVVIAFTGDLLNSDRRLDEMLNEATNRAKATFLAARIFEQFILDLASEWKVTVVGIVGNESRAKDEMGFTDIAASDSYDWTIMNLVKLRLDKEEDDQIVFLDSEAMEQVIKVAGQNILMLHGSNFGQDPTVQVAKAKQRYAEKGIKLDYIIFGHLHSAHVTEHYARGGSTVGNNAYNEHGLNLHGRASQNIYVFRRDGSRDGLMIDLQDTVFDGYCIEKELESYNAKSAKKARKQKAILEVVM